MDYTPRSLYVPATVAESEGYPMVDETVGSTASVLEEQFEPLESLPIEIRLATNIDVLVTRINRHFLETNRTTGKRAATMRIINAWAALRIPRVLRKSRGIKRILP